MNALDLLIAEVALLKKRVAQLEQAAYSSNEYVEGWNNAARLLGVSSVTVRTRVDNGELPQPCRLIPFQRKNGETYNKPVWRRADLENYAEGSSSPPR